GLGRHEFIADFRLAWEKRAGGAWLLSLPLAGQVSDLPRASRGCRAPCFAKASPERFAQARALLPGESEISNKFVPTQSADTNTVQAQADIKRLLSDLEAKKQVLADMLISQNAQTKNLLQSRDSELKILHERMQEVQRKIMNAAPPEARPVKKAEALPAIEEVAADSLTVTTSNAVTLRLPIPAP
ncbi:MAG: hypothetical protein KKD33_05815, partial [Verrucomicrobia bacterium]|nr:hypothetical protein [Verrucomicrobiota bacterium]